MRQAHPAIFRRGRDAAPAGLRPAAIDVGEARGRRDDAVFPLRAGEIARPVERRDFLRREAPGFADDRGDRLPVEFAFQFRLDQPGKFGDRLQGEQDIVRKANGRA